MAAQHDVEMKLTCSTIKNFFQEKLVFDFLKIIRIGVNIRLKRIIRYEINTLQPGHVSSV